MSQEKRLNCFFSAWHWSREQFHQQKYA